MTLQSLHLKNDVWERESDPATPTYLANPYLYSIGTIGGKIQPFGDGHLIGKMGGVWAHPLRILDGWSLVIETSGKVVPLEVAKRCQLYESHLVREFYYESLQILWTEFAPESVPALVSLITVQNTGETQWQGDVVLNVHVDPHSAWFSDWDIEETHVSAQNDSLLWSVRMADSNHSFLLGTSSAATWQISSDKQALLRHHLSLAPAATEELTGFVIIPRQREIHSIYQIREHLLGHEKQLLQEKIESYQKVDDQISLKSPSLILNRGWRVARLNLQLLVTDYRPFMPPYFLAGLPEYPQLFGCDTTYTVPGAIAGGFQDNARLTLLALADVAEKQSGKVPHELTTNGRIYNPGNTQETPQFVIAIWDYFRWTGNFDFLRALYPLCRRGMLEKLPGEFGFPNKPYLQGNGMVEVEGMAELKLDVQAYYLRGLECLSQMAKVLDKDHEVQEISSLLRNFAHFFHSEWWMPTEQLYADSMFLNGDVKLDGHWTVVVPLHLQLPEATQARRSLQRIFEDWVNNWGMSHTRHKVSDVWTLPTGLLALATFTYGDSRQGISLLENIAETSHYGLLGTLSELIPDGLCFIQLWSAGLLIQGVVEGLLGITPEAYRHHVKISPNIPPDWGEVELNGLTIGQHVVDLKVGSSSVFIRHREGTMPLSVSCTCNKRVAEFSLEAGDAKEVV